MTAALEKSSLMQDDEVAGEYLQRLEALQSVDHATGRQPVSDVRVPLARMLFLMKQTERARKVIRDYVAVAVQLLEESAGKILLITMSVPIKCYGTGRFAYSPTTCITL